MKPQNFEEKVIWYSITGIYVLYFLGAQHLWVPLIAWVLTLYLCKKLYYQTNETPSEEKITIPFGVWMWIIGMLAVAVSLIGAHLSFDYDLSRTIRSFINFFLRTWALLALFPLIGCLKIRPQLLARAACILSLQTLIFIAICYAASIIHLPPTLYISPLKKIGGVGDLYYKVGLYLVDQEVGNIRLFLFAPWAPALGLVGNVYFFICGLEPNKKWRRIGIIGSIAMIWFSVSRLGIVCLPFVIIVSWFLVNISRPSLQIATGVTSFFTGLFGFQLLSLLKAFKEGFDSQRASSSETRALLARMAGYRWWHEAPVWGHGFLTRGPKVAAYMPIGSHHTWFGILFANGIVGGIGLGIAVLWSFIDLVIKAQNSNLAYRAFSIFIVIMLYSFGENLDCLVYIYWPGLVMLGMGFQAKSETSLTSSSSGLLKKT